jgi:hypothetical protein
MSSSWPRPFRFHWLSLRRLGSLLLSISLSWQLVQSGHARQKASSTEEAEAAAAAAEET